MSEAVCGAQELCEEVGNLKSCGSSGNRMSSLVGLSHQKTGLCFGQNAGCACPWLGRGN